MAVLEFRQLEQMEIIMSTFEVELFIAKNTWTWEENAPEYIVTSKDMSMQSGHPLLGTQKVKLKVPSKKLEQAEIEMLEKKIELEKANTQSNIKKMEERIQELKCLEFKDGK